MEDRGTANYALAWLTRVTGAYELFEGTLYAAVLLGVSCALAALVSFSLAQTGVRQREPRSLATARDSPRRCRRGVRPRE